MRTEEPNKIIAHVFHRLVFLIYFVISHDAHFPESRCLLSLGPWKSLVYLKLLLGLTFARACARASPPSRPQLHSTMLALLPTVLAHVRAHPCIHSAGSMPKLCGCALLLLCGCTFAPPHPPRTHLAARSVSVSYINYD
jgi:hypothetical protein